MHLSHLKPLVSWLYFEHELHFKDECLSYVLQYLYCVYCTGICHIVIFHQLTLCDINLSCTVGLKVTLVTLNIFNVNCQSF